MGHPTTASVEEASVVPVPAPERPAHVHMFHTWCERAVAILPFGLDRILAPTLLGFAIINSFTGAVDLLLLTVLHGALDLPIGISVTIAYTIAFGLSYVLNRIFNFESHGALGRQVPIYVACVVLNFAVFILGVTIGLKAFGVEYHLARIVAGAGEAVFMYSAMRWLVFKR